MELRGARKDLKKSIAKVKDSAWPELIDSIDEDPWGRPYKIVTKKLRSFESPICETLELTFLSRAISYLFPDGDDDEAPWSSCPRVGLDDAPEVSVAELEVAANRLKNNGKSPGPDGFTYRILIPAVEVAKEIFALLFTRCLRQSYFPEDWKVARLVLLRKPNKPLDSVSSFRPICLLNTIGKLLEKIIANRIYGILERDKLLSEMQFGFRNGRSTGSMLLKGSWILCLG